MEIKGAKHKLIDFVGKGRQRITPREDIESGTRDKHKSSTAVF